jgi:hypothetical protein
MDYYKYPRTYHLDYSPNVQNDDRMHQNIDFLIDQKIVASIKMDGESTSMYSDYIHARSIDSKHHESRAYVKNLHGNIKHQIPGGWRICGENLYAKHSIHYKHLKSYFYVYSVWNQHNIALNWSDTVSFCDDLNLYTVPVFYVGIFYKDHINNLFHLYENISLDPVEGYVIRLAGEFHYKNYINSTAKYVRKDHVKSDKFWMTQPVIPNKIV